MNFVRSLKWNICVLSLFFGHIACAQDVASIPMTNGNFEEELAGWTIREKVPMSSINAEAAFSGNQGLRVVDHDASAGSNALSAPIQITGGQGYSLVFWAKTTSNNAAVVQLRFYDAKRKTLEIETGKLQIKSTANQWAKLTILARAPENAKTVAVWIHSYSGAKATLDFDDFSLQKVEPSEVAVLPLVTSADAGPAPENGVKTSELVETTPKLAKAPRQSPPYIMIKVDDLRVVNGRVHARWKKFAEFCRERKIRAGIGIICDSLEGDNPAYIAWIKEQQATGLFEFWNHGYDHSETEVDGKKLQEFKGPTYEQQKEHYTRSQKLAREKLGAPFSTFGAPFNATDANTAKVLSEDPDTKVWLYGDSKNTAGKLVLDRVYPVNIENPLFLPSLDKFIEGYNKYPQKEYFVIQGHAAKWDEPRFEQFTKIVDFLIEQKANFVTPTEFAKIKAARP
jgi:peptidoglycan/xylan/chitin deacetylase (PgdA/CDA1 family)